MKGPFFRWGCDINVYVLSEDRYVLNGKKYAVCSIQYVASRPIWHIAIQPGWTAPCHFTQLLNCALLQHRSLGIWNEITSNRLTDVIKRIIFHQMKLKKKWYCDAIPCTMVTSISNGTIEIKLFGALYNLVDRIKIGWHKCKCKFYVNSTFN